MDVGIGLPATIPGVEGARLIEWARRAEARGFSCLGNDDPDRLRELRPADRAGRGGGRDGAHPAGHDHPYLARPPQRRLPVAKQAASVDRLSGGRLVLGVAVGGREDDYEASGAEFLGRRRAQFDAMLDEWRRVWAGESFGTAGAVGPPPVRERPEARHRRLSTTADVTSGPPPLRRRLAVMGGGPPDLLARRQGKAGEAAAGRRAARDDPRIMALAYFALGPRAREGALKGTSGDYYTFTR